MNPEHFKGFIDLKGGREQVRVKERKLQLNITYFRVKGFG